MAPDAGRTLTSKGAHSSTHPTEGARAFSWMAKGCGLWAVGCGLWAVVSARRVRRHAPGLRRTSGVGQKLAAEVRESFSFLARIQVLGILKYFAVLDPPPGAERAANFPIEFLTHPTRAWRLGGCSAHRPEKPIAHSP